MSKYNKLPEDLPASDFCYRSLFESAPHGIIILDADKTLIINANPFVMKLTGFSLNELSGKELWKIGLFRNEEECRTAFQKMRVTDYYQNENFPLETKTGERRRIKIAASEFAAEGRRFIQCNLYEVISNSHEEQAQDSKMLAQIAGKTARLGGWTIQLPERTLTWSDENCSIHEVPPGYKPTLEEGINLFPPEYREEVIRYVERCAQEGTPYDFELPKYTAKGRLIWVRSIGEAVRDSDGKIIRLQGAFQDITERKQAELEKEKLIKELQAALAEIKTLRGILPICSYCKKVRDDHDYWSQIESYLSEHTHTKFSHGICPECFEIEVKPQLEKLSKKKTPRY